ncbi:MAG: tRNA methyltransferase [Sulfolobales archaeon]|nr:tRNA methyltransferase [Sulfolobales archaeon]
MTTHVGLVARAFGASGIVIADVSDELVVRNLRKVCEVWGGKDFLVTDGVNSLEYVEEWRKRGGVVVHLTMYGIHIDDVISEIRSLNRDMLVIVGASKVPRAYYELADYNVAIGHQPHSEVAALAVFLDRLYGGRELKLIYSDAKLRIEPSLRGKKVVMCERSN